MEATVTSLVKKGILSIEKKGFQWLLTLYVKDKTGVPSSKLHSWGDSLNVALEDLVNKTGEFLEFKKKQEEEEAKLIELFNEEE